MRGAREFFSSEIFIRPLTKCGNQVYHVINPFIRFSRRGGLRYDGQAARDGHVPGHVHVHVLRFPMRRPLNSSPRVQRVSAWDALFSLGFTGCAAYPAAGIRQYDDVNEGRGHGPPSYPKADRSDPMIYRPIGGVCDRMRRAGRSPFSRSTRLQPNKGEY